MESRGHKKNRFGTIDCELNHPIYGWIPYTMTTEESELVIDFEDYSPDISSVKADLMVAVDSCAGSVAESFAPYSLADQEYKLTQAQVAEWRSNGSPAGDIPSALQSWVDASGLSVEDAAASIESSADSLNSALLEIRRIRLKAKRDIMGAETIEVAVNIRNTALTELEALK